MDEYIYMVVVPHERSHKMLPLVPIKHMTEYADSAMQYMNVETTFMRAAMKEELIKVMGTPDDDFGPMIVPGLTWIKQTRCIQVKHT